MPVDRISINSNICHGQACVKGTRMPVYQIVRMMEDVKRGPQSGATGDFSAPAQSGMPQGFKVLR